MGHGRGKINSKEQQYSAGNWGHPRPFTKKHTKIADPLCNEEPKHLSSKKYKKKEKVKLPFWHCPFCKHNIEKKETMITDKRGFFTWDPHEVVCNNCKSFEIEGACPACKRNTWFKPDDNTLTTGEYSHLFNRGCGFSGKKLTKGK